MRPCSHFASIEGEITEMRPVCRGLPRLCGLQDQHKGPRRREGKTGGEAGAHSALPFTTAGPWVKRGTKVCVQGLSPASTLPYVFADVLEAPRAGEGGAVMH